MAKLTPIHPSAAIRDAYQRRLDAAIDRMSRDTTRTLTAAYKANPPSALILYGMDASPARIMANTMRGLSRKWLGYFDDLAPSMAEWFAKSVKARCDRELAGMLRRGGMSVKFKMTAAMNDAFQAVRAENVNLITSIPSEYMTQVETMVMQSVSAGRDIGTLAKGLEQRLGITKRRAALIARDQNTKATSIMLRTRQLGMGIEEAKWLHSAGGKVPRPKHVAFTGHRFNLAKGHDFDDGEGAVLPGQPINCFPGDTPVRLKSQLVALWRAAFDGPMVHIQVGSDLIKGTPNHPILTARGWVALGDLNCGDEIVCMASERGGVVTDDEHDPVTLIGDLFEAMAIRWGYGRRTSSGFDFYGDGTHGQVDQVVIPHMDLAVHDKSAFSEKGGNFVFPESDGMIGPHILCPVHEAPPPAAPSGLTVGLAGVEAVALHARSIGIGSPAHQALANKNISDGAGGVAGRAKRRGDCRGAEPLGVQFDNPIGADTPINALIVANPHGAEALGEFVSIAANRKGGIFEFGSVRYELRCVTDKIVRDFSGHVFTLETTSGHYGVSRACIQAKNCRCVWVPVIPGFDDD